MALQLLDSQEGVEGRGLSWLGSANLLPHLREDGRTCVLPRQLLHIVDWHTECAHSTRAKGGGGDVECSRNALSPRLTGTGRAHVTIHPLPSKGQRIGSQRLGCALP